MAMVTPPVATTVAGSTRVSVVSRLVVAGARQHRLARAATPAAAEAALAAVGAGAAALARTGRAGQQPGRDRVVGGRRARARSVPLASGVGVGAASRRAWAWGWAAAPRGRWTESRASRVTRGVAAGFGAGLAVGLGVGLGVGFGVGLGVGAGLTVTDPPLSDASWRFASDARNWTAYVPALSLPRKTNRPPFFQSWESVEGRMSWTAPPIFTRTYRGSPPCELRNVTANVIVVVVVAVRGSTSALTRLVGPEPAAVAGSTEIAISNSAARAARMAGWPSRWANALKPVAWCTVLLTASSFRSRAGYGRSIRARQAARYGTGVPAREGPPTLARSVRASRGPVGRPAAEKAVRPGTGRGAVRWGRGQWSVRSSGMRSRMVPLTRSRGSTTIRYMQVIAADAPRSRRDRLVILRSAATGVLLIVAGVLIGWLCLGTPLVNSFIPDGRPTTFQTALGVMAWGFAILVPAGFLLFGVARMAHTIDAATSLRPTTVTPTLARALGPDHLAATDLRLPGGRRIHELVLGPFGILVLGDVPPAAVSRHVGQPLGDPRRPRPMGPDRGPARSRVP